MLPLGGNTPRLQASIALRGKRVFVINSVRYCVGLNAGFVVQLSSAAVTYSFDSSLPRAALILCSVYAPIFVIGVRTLCEFNALGLIILRAASTGSVAPAASSSL